MAERSVYDDVNSFRYWCEYQQGANDRCRVRLMRRWKGWSDDVVKSRRCRSEAKARAVGQRWLDRLAARYEGWEVSDGR